MRYKKQTFLDQLKDIGGVITQIGTKICAKHFNHIEEGIVEVENKIDRLHFTPQMYGAAGDGATDDTKAFRQALAENRIVHVPGGRYVLSDTLVVRANCCLELSQDTVLEFVNEEKNGIALLRAAHLRGNHAPITVPYTLSANVIHCDTGEDEAALGVDATDDEAMKAANNTAVPPFVKWDPQWKMTRYVTDVNICKPDDRGFHYSKDGDCFGTAIYLHCDAADYVSYMWGVSMSGVRIAGGFEYGIRACNIGDAWNHDMRIEALIDACKVGVSMENCHYARLAVTVQPRRAYSDAEVYKAYAENGILLRGCRGIDLSGSRVWDWNAEATLWAEGNPYQHIALLGECRGLILDDFLYHEQSSIDIRRLIYTDTPANLENMTILQEPIDRYFKNKNGVPYFHDGSRDSKLISQEEMDAHFDTDFVKSFTDVLAAAEDTDGTVLNGVGYKIGARLHENGTLTESPYYGYTGFIPCAKGSTIYAKDLSFDAGDDFAKVIFYDAEKNYINHVNRGNIVKGNNYYAAYTSKEDGFALTVNSISNNNDVAYARFTFYKTGFGEHPMMAVDEEIQYTVEGYLADSVKVKAKNVVSDITAAVGQTIVVKSVDENGKPTEWEAVNAGEKWETIAEFTVEESVSTIEIDKDLNGENFRLRKAVVVIENVLNGKEGCENNNLGIRVFIRSKPFDGTYEQMNKGFIRRDVNNSYGNPFIEGSSAKGKHFIAAIEVNDAYWSVIKKIAGSDTAESIYAPNQIGSRIGGISLQTGNSSTNAYGVGTNIRIMGVRE